MFSLLAPAYAKKYGVDEAELKDVMARIAWKNHYNGARNPRAQFRKEVSKEAICASPLVAGPLGIFDCSGVSDGAAAAIIVRAEDAHRYTDKPIYVKALAFAAGPAEGPMSPEYDYTSFTEVVRSAEDAYAQAGITNPRAELAMAEVHDCFTPTELVLMEDLGFAERGFGWKEVLAGTYDLDGELAVNPDGGLKSFGHPIGASGLRMLFEAWLQLRREAPPERAIKSVSEGGRKLALTHNLGGAPGECVSFVSVVGSEPSAQGRLRQKADRATLDVGEAELPGGGQGLVEELPGPPGVAGLAAGEEHPGPLQPGAGQPDRSADALVGGGGIGEAALRLVEVVEVVAKHRPR